MNIRQSIIVRTDLGFSFGLLAAQIAHIHMEFVRNLNPEETISKQIFANFNRNNINPQTKENIMILTQHDKEIIECVINQWAELSLALYGGISYNCVYDFCKKLDIAIPKELEYICSEKYEKDMNEKYESNNS